MLQRNIYHRHHQSKHGYSFWGYSILVVLIGTFDVLHGTTLQQQSSVAAAESRHPPPPQLDESVSSSASASSSYWCNEDHDDYVQSLPGYGPVVPPSCWYSGYVHYEIAGRAIHTHYTLQIAEFITTTTTGTTTGASTDSTVSPAQNVDVDNHYDPFQKPLIYWSNGGPGASSMFGLLTELGNLLFSNESLNTEEYRKSGGIPTPIYNPNSWSRLGHLLSFDQPAPVGFSYCGDDPNNTTHPHSCDGIVWDDTLTAQAAYQAMLAFYNKFPLFTNVDLYLTGESYAGIYIPTLAREIIQHNDHLAVPLKLRGFAVGDGCLGTETGICGVLNPDTGFDVWNAVFLAGHGQIPMSTFAEVMNACYHNHNHDPSISEQHSTSNDFASTYVLRRLQQQQSSRDDSHSSVTMSCSDAMKQMDDQAGGVYAYGLYDDCTYSNGIKQINASLKKSLHGGVNDYACGGDLVMADYLNRPDVRKALNVEKREFFTVDNAEGDFDYTPSEPDLTDFYKAMNGKLRILVYNGDTDPAINSFAAQNWTSHLGLKEVEPWRPWTVDGCRRMGGYVTRYEGNFDFLTIRGAGHMVPTNKAEAALAFISSWIENRAYATYDKDCISPNNSFNFKL